MKKEKLYIVAFIAFLLSGACSKDLGNYNYGEVNQISIDSLLHGGHHTSRIYTLSFNDTLKLRPTVTGTLSKTDTANLEFEWFIDGQEVSRHSKLDYVANEKYGKLEAEFYVHDKSTGIKTSNLFFIDVVNPYKLGYYVLSRKENGEAVLYCRSTIKANATFENMLIPTLNPLGQEPISIASSRKYGASSSDYYNQIVLGVRQSIYPVVVLDSREFIPVLLYNQSSYVGEDSFTFDPVNLSMSPVLSNLVIYATNSNGKIHSLWKGAISQAHGANDPLDYQVAPKGFASPYGFVQSMASFYDKKNSRIRVIGLDTQTPVTYFFARSFDDIEGIDQTDGHEFIYAAESYLDSYLSPFVYLTKQGNTLYSFKLGVNSSTDFTPRALTKIAETTIPNIDELSFTRYDISGLFWYVSIGRTIYRASVLGLDLQPYITLPEEATGPISTFHFANNQLIAATYDSAAKKSSVYIYNNTNQALLYAEGGLEQVVDLIVGI